MARQRSDVVTITASRALTDGDDGIMLLCGAADLVITLPAVSQSNKGCRFFIKVLAAGLSVGTGLSISPAAADTIFGRTAAGVAFAGDADDDIINTGATDVAGDSVMIISDGTLGWHVVAIQGVWASEA